MPVTGDGAGPPRSGPGSLSVGPDRRGPRPSFTRPRRRTPHRWTGPGDRSGKMKKRGKCQLYLLGLHQDILRKIFDASVLIGMCVCKRFRDELPKCVPVNLKFVIKASSREVSVNKQRISFCRRFHLLKVFLVMKCEDNVAYWGERLEGSSAAKLLLPWLGLEDTPQVVSLQLANVSLGPSGAKRLAERYLPKASMLTVLDLTATRWEEFFCFSLQIRQ
jgi:hypothetical protein